MLTYYYKVAGLRLCKMRVLKYYANLKHYLRHENKANENKVLSYCEALRYMLIVLKNYDKLV